MMVDMGSVFLYLAGIFLLYLGCRVFLKPLKWLLRLFFSCLIAVGGILGCNLLFGAIGWHIAINPLNAMITGVMGIPGMIMTRVLSLLL